MKKTSLVLLFFLLSFSAYANSLSGFCFSQNTSLNSVIQYINPILKRSEVVDKRQSINCIELPLSNARRELFSSYISRQFKIIKTYVGEGSYSSSNLSSNSQVKINCHFKIDKITTINSLDNNLQIGRKNNINQSNTKRSRKSTSSLLVGVGRSSSFRMDDKVVYIKCLSKSREGHNVEVSLSDVDSSISTTIFLGNGQRENLGGIVDDLSGKDSKLSIKSGVSVQRSKGQKNTQYFMYGI